MLDLEPVLEMIRCQSNFIYVVTEEEDLFLTKLNERLIKSGLIKCTVYNSSYGAQPLPDLVNSWKDRSFKPSQVDDLNIFLRNAYSETCLSHEVRIYILTDPETCLAANSGMAVRRLLNLAHQLNSPSDTGGTKIVIFVGQRPIIHPKLQRYVEVVRVKPLSSEGVREILSERVETLKKFKDQIKLPSDAEIVAMSPEFVGLTSYEIKLAIRRSVRMRKSDPKVVSESKKGQLGKTELISFLDVENHTFDNIGGAQRFKEWAHKTKAAWTPEGQKFGLKPPRGVVLAGVWGCGKSLSVKALGQAWGLPVIQLDMGKLRESAVGHSEENLARVTSLIETVSPCIVFIDEAEKGLGGSEASGKTDSGLTARLIGSFSTWMQESPAPFCVVMTANSVEAMPIEFIRRSNERFFFELPTEEDRVDILKIHLTKRGQDTSNFNLAKLAEDSKLMVGSEIEHAVEAALVEAFHAKQQDLPEDLLSQELKRKPRIFKMLGPNLKALLDWVGYDPETDDGIRARFASDRRSEGFKEIYGLRN